VRTLQVELGEVSPTPTRVAKAKKGKGKQRAAQPLSSSTRATSAAGRKRGRDSDDSGPSDPELRPSNSKSARPSATRRVVISSDSDSDDAPEPKTPRSAAVELDDKPEPRVFGNKIDHLHDLDAMRFVFDKITADDFVNKKTERLVSFILVHNHSVSL
jgi:hypothetical protein